ncbi:hypothetical protein KKI24_17655, partial [bacterium]|nr:hypothetical protein [bacterium]
ETSGLDIMWLEVIGRNVGELSIEMIVQDVGWSDLCEQMWSNLAERYRVSPSVCPAKSPTSETPARKSNSIAAILPARKPGRSPSYESIFASKEGRSIRRKPISASNPNPVSRPRLTGDTLVLSLMSCLKNHSAISGNYLMTEKVKSDIAASILRRLLNQARAKQEDFNHVLNR